MDPIRLPPEESRRSTPVAVSVLVYDGAEELEFVGPWEVFSVANGLYPGSFPTRLVTTGRPSVQARDGLDTTHVESIYESPTPRVLLLPGGPGRAQAMKETRLLGYVRRVHSLGTLPVSVGTGAFILAAAGLLDGKRATTLGSALDELKGYPYVRVVQKRFVDEGDVATAAGGPTGVDLSLHLIARFLGPEASRRVAHVLVYAGLAPQRGEAPKQGGTKTGDLSIGTVRVHAARKRARLLQSEWAHLPALWAKVQT